MPSLTLKDIPVALMERLRGNPRVLEQCQASPDRAATTWITACELAYGAANSLYPDRNRTLVTEFLATLSVLDFSLPSALLFGQHKARLRRGGVTVADADLTIAAIALAQGATLVTGNTRHYDRFEGLPLEDWIRQPPAGDDSRAPD